MKIKTIEVNGWLKEDSDSGLEVKEKAEEWYGESIVEEVMGQLGNIGRVVEAGYRDWSYGDYHYLDQVFCRWYMSKEKCTWEQVQADHIKQIAGSATVAQYYSGYSEYTVDSSWGELKFGEHDLIEELLSHYKKLRGRGLEYKPVYLLLKIDIKFGGSK
jgi:hypothetical protein